MWPQIRIFVEEKLSPQLYVLFVKWNTSLLNILFCSVSGLGLSGFGIGISCRVAKELMCSVDLWFEKMIVNKEIRWDEKERIMVYVGVVCWFIWKERCNCVFECICFTFTITYRYNKSIPKVTLYFLLRCGQKSCIDVFKMN